MHLRVGAVAVGLLGTALAAIEDIAHCDPSDKDEHPGFASKAVFDFTTASWGDDFEHFWKVDEDSADDKRRIDFDSDEDGVALGIWQSGQSASLTSKKYLFFGKVSVEVQAAEGQGVVTKIMLKSDSGNEIDWEILGSYENEAQTNYFYDGNAEFNKYNDTYDIPSSVFNEAHTYSVEWTQEAIKFSIDGEERKVKKPVGDIPAREWPHAPMHVALSIWAVDEDDYAGVDAWAGGLPDWDEAPFKAYFRRVEIEDFAGYCKEVDRKVEYSYNERMVDWRQVSVSGCKYKQEGMLTPHVPSGGDSIPTYTSGGYPAPSETTSTTDGDAEPTSGEDTSTGGGDNESTSTDGGSAPPQETAEDDEDAAAVFGCGSFTLVALVTVASLMGML